MSNVFSKHNATKKIEVPLTEANFRVLLQPLCREGLGVGLAGGGSSPLFFLGRQE